MNIQKSRTYHNKTREPDIFSLNSDTEADKIILTNLLPRIFKLGDRYIPSFFTLTPEELPEILLLLPEFAYQRGMLQAHGRDETGKVYFIALIIKRSVKNNNSLVESDQTKNSKEKLNADQ